MFDLGDIVIFENKVGKITYIKKSFTKMHKYVIELQSDVPGEGYSIVVLNGDIEQYDIQHYIDN